MFPFKIFRFCYSDNQSLYWTSNLINDGLVTYHKNLSVKHRVEEQFYPFEILAFRTLKPLVISCCNLCFLMDLQMAKLIKLAKMAGVMHEADHT